IWNGFTINGGEDDYTWSEPYVDNSQVIITKKDSGISTLSDLAGKTVLVQADSAALSALESDDLKEVTETFGELTQVADYNSALMTLESGAADAVALDKVVAQYYVKDKEDTFSIMDEELSTEQYGIGFKKGNEALRDKVQETLNAMLDDGKFVEIATKWDQQDVICLGK
ncbi:MAG: transporter substrate-binding domain-containing protein, partial [Lachnospiraceae bacterium]|nr:transporter substrate-binding domain-containing protein [Lachnospiraceae bacterium]